MQIMRWKKNSLSIMHYHEKYKQTFKQSLSSKKKNFNCNSKVVVYFIKCRVCGNQYNGSTVTKFRARVNNYKSAHRNFWKEQKLSKQARNQKRFHEHYLQKDHNEISDWETTIKKPC